MLTHRLVLLLVACVRLQQLEVIQTDGSTCFMFYGKINLYRLAAEWLPLIIFDHTYRNYKQTFTVHGQMYTNRIPACFLLRQFPVIFAYPEISSHHFHTPDNSPLVIFAYPEISSHHFHTPDNSPLVIFAYPEIPSHHFHTPDNSPHVMFQTQTLFLCGNQREGVLLGWENNRRGIFRVC